MIRILCHRVTERIAKRHRGEEYTESLGFAQRFVISKS
jgi:hypothetical protein